METIGQFLPLIVLFAIFYFIMIRPQMKQQKEHKKMLSELKKGDRVVSTGGFIVEIMRVEGDHYAVMINDDTKVKLAKDFVVSKYDPMAYIEAQKQQKEKESKVKGKDKDSKGETKGQDEDKDTKK